MGLRNLFRRRSSKAPKKEASKKLSKKDVMEEDKLPTDAPAMPEKASVAPTVEPIEEDRDDSTLETDDDVPTPEVESVKVVEEPKAVEKSKFGCCEPEVFQNLQAAVGLVSS